MIWARAVCSDEAQSLALAFGRMGLPTAAAEYLLEKVPHTQVLLSGISAVEGRFLRQPSEAVEPPGAEQFPRFAPGDVQRRPGTALLSGDRDQFRRLVAAAAAPELAPLKAALSRLLEPNPPSALQLGGRLFEWGRRTFTMGILNVTPDSFADGGRYVDPARAIAHGVAMARAGADILDVGGESTRPGAQAVSEAEELERVIPVIRGLCQAVETPVSVDTRKASVARQALAAGASLVNDISGMTFDPKMAETVARAEAACCLMHIRGVPQTMQEAPAYDDVVAEVLEALSQSMDRAVKEGVRRQRVMVDPGIGFGKTLGQNLVLLRRLADFRQLGAPVLVGTSRKSSLGKLVGDKPASERLAATLGSVGALAMVGGADMVRVHDVGEVRDALAVADAIRHASEAGGLFGRA